MRLRSLVFRVSATAVMTALGVALAYLPRLLAGDLAGRLDLAILPVLLLASLFGPVWSTLSYTLTDVIGCLLNGYAPFLPITVCKLVLGLILGLFFYRKDFTPRRTALAFAVGALVVDFGMMLFAMRWYYQTFMPDSPSAAWDLLVVARAITAAVNFVLRTVFCLTAGRVVRRQVLPLIR